MRSRLAAKALFSVALCAMEVIGCSTAPTPAITIASPSSEDQVSGVVTVTASASSSEGIADVEFVVDAISVGKATTPPFSVDWDSSPFVGKTVEVVATAHIVGGATSISPPVELRVRSAAPSLPLGRESMYTLVNEGVLERADELLRDVWDIGPRSPPVYLSPVTWTEDPYQDAYWRLLFYGLRPTTNLLWAYYTTADARYRDKLLQILSSYTAYDKVRPTDVNTFDADYAAAFRAMVLVNSYFKLKRSGDLPAQLDADLLQSIEKLGAALAAPGGYTGSFGNHGFTSAASLALLAENIVSPDAASWRTIAYGRMEQLIVNAVDSDGVEIENSPFYHFYVMTFAEEITSWAQLWGVALPPNFASRTDAMSGYASYILQPDLSVPLLGATVTTSVASMDPTVQAEISARDPGFAFVASQGKVGTAPSSLSRLFPESGQSVLRSGFDPPPDFANQTFMTFNAGPYRNAHNHLDVLALTYFAEGRSLLTDSGLFTYTPGADFDYFRGTRAHNTVVVDGQDQSQQQLAFAGLSAEGAGWAYQSGVHQLYAGVTHRRGVLILQKDLAVLVDHLLSSASHAYTQTWHFAPDLLVTLSAQGADATDAPAGAPLLSLVEAAANASATTTSGALQPIQGWYSERYGVKVPNVALEYQQSGPTASFVTLLASGPFAGTHPTVLVDQDDDTAIRLRICADAVRAGIEIDHLADQGESVSLRDSAAGCP